ncbi:MAG: hypothetical protein OXC69_01350, partial [Candidatus Tectomicrobia bacterium]|nr:hypothetical protein [Candidatus Tectomicrobia bacterium]
YLLIHFRPYLGQTCQNIHKRVPLVCLLAIDRVEGSGRTVESCHPSTNYQLMAKANLPYRNGLQNAVAAPEGLQVKHRLK